MISWSRQAIEDSSAPKGWRFGMLGEHVAHACEGVEGEERASARVTRTWKASS